MNENIPGGLLQGLSAQECDRVQALARSRSLPADGYLFHQNSDASHHFVVLEGVLMLERFSEEGLRQVMAFVFPGNYIGVSNEGRYQYTAKALTDVSLVEIRRRDFSQLSEEIPRLRDNLDTITSTVMLRLFDQLFALGKKKAPERLAFLLQQLSERQATDRDAHVRLVMSRQDIGDYLGLTLESVSRALGGLKDRGVIRVHRAHQVEILDREELARLAYLG